MTKIDKPIISWTGLYSEKYGSIITSESTGHPAKMSRGLVFKIYEYALEQGYIKKGDWILDPFFGVGCTALPALMHGINIWGNELEPFFVDCARGGQCTGISKQEWVRFYGRWRRAAYKDRHFCPQCITQAERPIKAIELPLSNASKKRRARIVKLEANLRDKGKPHRATLVNPIPFPEKFTHLAKQANMFSLILEASYERNSHIIPHTTPHHYTGNLENWRKYAKGGAVAVCTMGDSRRLTSIIKEQMEGVVSSPPYEGLDLGGGGGIISRDDTMRKTHGFTTQDGNYSVKGNANQLGNSTGITFWSASKDILLQCWQLLKPGAYSFWVVKMYVKDGKLVDFPGQWLKLCEVCGFEHVKTIIAWQTEDKGTNYDLDGGKQKKVVRRQSFFRLLHIKNHPELAIDCEIVLIMRKHPHR